MKRLGGLEIYRASAGVNTINPSSQVTEAEYEVQFNVTSLRHRTPMPDGCAPRPVPR